MPDSESTESTSSKSSDKTSTSSSSDSAGGVGESTGDRSHTSSGREGSAGDVSNRTERGGLSSDAKQQSDTKKHDVAQSSDQAASKTDKTDKTDKAGPADKTDKTGPNGNDRPSLRGQTCHTDQLQSGAPKQTDQLQSGAPKQTDQLQSAAPKQTDQLQSAAPKQTDQLQSAAHPDAGNSADKNPASTMSKADVQLKQEIESQMGKSMTELTAGLGRGPISITPTELKKELIANGSMHERKMDDHVQPVMDGVLMHHPADSYRWVTEARVGTPESIAEQKRAGQVAHDEQTISGFADGLASELKGRPGSASKVSLDALEPPKMNTK